MDPEVLRKSLSKLRASKQTFLNETFLWVKIAIDAVRELPDTNFEFTVPRSGDPQRTKKTMRCDFSKLKNRIISKDIYNSAFVTIVGAIDDYFSKIIKIILDYDNTRIKSAISKINTYNSTYVRENINDETILDDIIISLLYLSPRKQIEFLNTVLEINIEEIYWNHWIEIKARRDILVHNGGIINDIYIKKTRMHHCCKIGDEAFIDYEYFSDSISMLKKMLGVLDGEIRKVYGLVPVKKGHRYIENFELLQKFKIEDNPNES